MHGRRRNRGNLLVILGLLGGSILPLASSFPVGKLLGLILSEKDFMNNRINRHIELLLRRLFLETQDPNMDPCTPVGPQGDRCQARGLQRRLDYVDRSSSWWPSRGSNLAFWNDVQVLLTKADVIGKQVSTSFFDMGCPNPQREPALCEGDSRIAWEGLRRNVDLMKPLLIAWPELRENGQILSVVVPFKEVPEQQPIKTGRLK